MDPIKSGSRLTFTQECRWGGFVNISQSSVLTSMSLNISKLKSNEGILVKSYFI